MNVLIAGGFWAIAKFMVLLCGTVILIIKSIYVYQNMCIRKNIRNGQFLPEYYMS